MFCLVQTHVQQVNQPTASRCSNDRTSNGSSPTIYNCRLCSSDCDSKAENCQLCSSKDLLQKKDYEIDTHSSLWLQSNGFSLAGLTVSAHGCPENATHIPPLKSLVIP